jgi:predicted Zn-dependent peptidase
MQSLSAALDDMYGARIEPYVRKRGEVHCVGFYADFLDDDFVPGGESVLARALGLLGEMLLSPRTRAGLIDREYVEGERRNLIDDIRAGINDKRAYARDALLREMCSGEAYGVNRLGSIAAAEGITAKSLTAHWREVLDTAKCEIIYCGAAPSERALLAAREAFAPLLSQVPAEEPSTKLVYAPRSGVRRFSESFDVTQGKLALGFRLGETMKAPNYAALAVLDAVFGGCVSSKLFLNVREKLSLCYYASSSIDNLKGVMAVSSGVEFSDMARAEEEILSQLAAIQNGEVSEWELVSAKRAIITSRLGALDSPSGLENAHFDRQRLGAPYSPEEFAALIDAVQPGEVVEAARSVALDSVYTLVGREGSK